MQDLSVVEAKLLQVQADYQASLAARQRAAALIASQFVSKYLAGMVGRAWRSWHAVVLQSVAAARQTALEVCYAVGQLRAAVTMLISISLCCA